MVGLEEGKEGSVVCRENRKKIKKSRRFWKVFGRRGEGTGSEVKAGGRETSAFLTTQALIVEGKVSKSRV